MYVVTMKLTVHPGSEDEAERLFEESVREIKAEEPGTILFSYQRHKREDRTYLVYEAYSDKDAFKAHVDRMPASAARAKMNDVIESRGDPDRYDLVAGIGFHTT